jgi:hypothetical protein
VQRCITRPATAKGMTVCKLSWITKFEEGFTLMVFCVHTLVSSLCSFFPVATKHTSCLYPAFVILVRPPNNGCVNRYLMLLSLQWNLQQSIRRVYTLS